jgi:outer membrane protein W
MKRNLLLIIALFVATSMSAQFYAGLGVGYALGASKRVNGTEVSGTVTTNIYGSYGQGFSPNLKLGFMFSDNMGIELGVSYLFGASQTKTKTEYILKEAKSDGLRLAPQLVYKLDNGFYGRFGMIIPVLGKTVITETDDKFNVSPIPGSPVYVKKETEMETKGSFSIGFIGAIGYGYSLNDNMTIFGEVEYIGLSIKSGSSTFTKYDVAGKDQLANMKTAQKEYEFVDEIDSSFILFLSSFHIC